MTPNPSSSATTTGPSGLIPVPSIPGYSPEAIMVTGIPGVNESKGAPMDLRAALAAVRRPAQKLEILRRVDPNATTYGKGNFVYTPPGSTQPVVFDPKGMGSNHSAGGYGALAELGKDIVEMLPFGAELGASIAGGVGGALVGGPTGAVTGAGVGGAAARDITEQALLAASGQQDPRTLRQRAGDVAATGVVSGLGETASRVVAPVGRAVANAFEGTPTGILTRQAAERLSVPLTAGMASGRKFFQMVEGALSGNPVTGGIMSRALDDATQAAQTASSRIVSTMARGGDTSPGSFTQAVQAAAEGRIQRFKNVRQTMDDVIGSIIPDNTLAPLDNVEKVLGELLALQSKAPMSLGPEVQQAVSAAAAMVQDAAANGGMLPFDVLRKLRTTIGEASSFGSTTGDRVAGGSSHLRDLYTAISDDITAAGRLVDNQALAAGLPTPGAEQAIEIHDAFVRLNRDPKNPVSIEAMQELMKANPSSPSQWGVTITGDPRKARAIRQAVKPEEWDTIAGSIFEDMGRAKPGAQGVDGDLWSPSTFLTNWNRLKDTGREALFGGTRYASVADDINALARVAEGIKNGGRYINTSQTARALLMPLMLGGAGAIVGGSRGEADRGFFLGATVGSGAIAKLLTSPRVMSTIREGVVSGARRGPGFLARLVAIARADQELRGPINEYIAAIGQAGYPLPDPATVQQLNTGSPAVQFTPR